MARGSPSADKVTAALGFRVKSGWALSVLLAGTPDSPKLIQCQDALLSDPHVPESKQPYHAAMELPANQTGPLVQKLRKIISAAAEESVSKLLKEAREAGYAVQGAALVVGSIVDPASLHNEHIRAHALEGQLFRTVLEDAFRSSGLPCQILVEKTAYATAAAALHKTPGTLKRVAAELGITQSGPWRAEGKLAAVAAWMALNTRA